MLTRGIALTYIVSHRSAWDRLVKFITHIFFFLLFILTIFLHVHFLSTFPICFCGRFLPMRSRELLSKCRHMWNEDGVPKIETVCISDMECGDFEERD